MSLAAESPPTLRVADRLTPGPAPLRDSQIARAAYCLPHWACVTILFHSNDGVI